MIDAHVHFWRLADDFPIGVNRRIAGVERDFVPADLRPLCTSLGFDRVIVMQAAASVSETRALLDLARHDPFIAAVVGWIDVESEACGATLDALMTEPKFAGVRLMAADVADANWLVGETVLRAVRELVDRDLAVDFLVRPSQLKALRSLLLAVPGVRANINHCARPLTVVNEWEPWATDMEAISRLDNVTCKYSGLIERGGFEWSLDMLRPYVHHLLNTFGAERMIFASNWPIINLVGNYQRWWEAANSLLAEAGTSGPDRDAIFRSNAARFYRVQDVIHPAVVAPHF